MIAPAWPPGGGAASRGEDAQRQERRAAAAPAWPAPRLAERAQWIFEDPASQALREVIHQVAPSEAGVLIYGEDGADKELIARYIHDLSPRRHGPFVTFNCGALSEALVNAELFGHESGAFTGALASLPGRFEDAHGGTLLLDEIDDLPLPMQAKLVRVLQDRAVARLGASRRVAVDVRVLAGSGVNLEQAVAARRFREDLYYRLNVVRLDVLPLRRRPGDILPLARHFIQTYCRRLNYAEMELSVPAQAALLRYPWPGNLRELENVIHRTLLLTRGLRIGAEDLRLPELQDEPSPGPPAEPQPGPPRPADAVPDPALDLALDEALDGLCDRHAQGLEQMVQNALLLKVWRRNRFNQVQTAAQLGISRSVVRARLKRLGQLGPDVE